MLPDFTKTRAQLEKLELKRVQGGVTAQMGVMGTIKSRVVHEGASSRLYREDGSIQDILFQEIKTEVTIPVAEAEKWTEVESFREQAKVVGEMAKKTAEVTLGKLDEEIDKVGNSIDAKGNFTGETYLLMLEKILISFDDEGNPYMPSIVAGSDATLRIAAAQQEILDIPTLRERMESIMRVKKETWYAREADRTLVG